MKTTQYVRQEKAIADLPPECATTPCVECGRPVKIYPPEDGYNTRWRCGRCSGSPLAVRLKGKARPPVDPWYIEQEQRIQDGAIEVRRLRAESGRLFSPGHLYVIEFESGVIKVGRAGNADARLAAHAKVGLIRSSWSSARHPYCDKTERQLIAFCNEHGLLHGGREYFRHIDFEVVRAYAVLIVRNELRRLYLERLIEAANDDMSMTWQEAHDRLPGEPPLDP